MGSSARKGPCIRVDQLHGLIGSSWPRKAHPDPDFRTSIQRHENLVDWVLRDSLCRSHCQDFHHHHAYAYHYECQVEILLCLPHHSHDHDNHRQPVCNTHVMLANTASVGSYPSGSLQCPGKDGRDLHSRR